MIDWEDLASRIGCLTDGSTRGVTRRDALRALEILVGEAELRSIVDGYVADLSPGIELGRGVLHVLQPVAAMDRCHEIFRAGAQQADRVSAVELLRSIADRHALPWIAEFLSDSNLDIQVLGAEVLENIVGRDPRGEDLFGVIRVCSWSTQTRLSGRSLSVSGITCNALALI